MRVVVLAVFGGEVLAKMLLIQKIGSHKKFLHKIRRLKNF
jgi:hypothetical protein